MKKLTALIIFAVAMTLAGCDTTDTTTIQIALGNDRASSPPDSISAVYIGVFHYSLESGIGAPVAALSTPPIGIVSMVVPAKRDLYVIVMSMDNDISYFWYGGTMYLGATGEIGGELIGKRRGDDSDVVQVYMSQYGTGPNMTYVEAEDGSGPMDESGINVICGLDSTPPFPSIAADISEFHIDKKINDGSYTLIDKEAYSDSGPGYVHFDDLTNVNPFPGTIYNYRVRLYVPAFGLYFYKWGNEDYEFTGGDVEF